MIELHQHLHGRPVVQLGEAVAAAAGDGRGAADRSAALGDDGVDGDVSLQGHPHASGAVHVSVEEEAVSLQHRGESANLGRPGGVGVVQALHQGTGVEGGGAARIDEQQEVRRGRRLDSQALHPALWSGVQVGKVPRLKVKGVDLDIGKDGRHQGEAGPLLDLATAADDARGGAAEEGLGRQVALDELGDPVVGLFVVVGDKSEDEIGAVPSQLSGDFPFQLGSGSGGVRLTGDGGGPLHVCAFSRL